MLTPQQIKKILQENNTAVLKKFGQNFLISESVLNKIVETADIKPTDTILEIGPGLGVLTFELAKRAKQVIAIEKDRKLSITLEKSLRERNMSNVQVINDDALVQRSTFNVQRYKLVANLPYNIATAVIMRFLESENPPQQIVVMVQKEVAQRIVAQPPHMNKLAIFCQLYSSPKIIDIVPPTAFWPKPKVDSAVLQLTSMSKEPSYFGGRSNSVPSISKTIFEQIVNLGFSHPRKTLLNNFVGGLPSFIFEEGRPPQFSKEKIGQWLLENNIQPSQRPETLSIHNWLGLAKTFET